MKRLPTTAIVVVLSFSIATTFFYVASLARMLSVARNDMTLSLSEFPKQTKEFPWKRTQVALNFTNDLFHITSDEYWTTLQPNVFLDETGQENMISMHQQLHCLDVIRVAYLSYHARRPKLTPSLYEDAEICLEQLRQSIMCNADLALEPTKLNVGKDGLIQPGSTGVGVLHRCQDWQELNLAVEVARAERPTQGFQN